jgi:protein kinase-like protein
VSRQPDDDTLDATKGPSGLVETRSGPPPGMPGTPFAPGSIITGRYRLVALLGRGGMGEVYRADDMTLDQPVALKFLPGENIESGASGNREAQLAQFHNELRVARQVSHRNVCRLYDLGETAGRRFLTMEYVDGEDLASLLRRIGRIPEDKAIQISRQLCAGLAAAHDRGVLHRDLKPANVMIDGNGDVRITDFGLAVMGDDGAAIRAGTPQYMAPEQLTGEPATIKTDLYALGLILFEVFTGRRAYDAKTLRDLMQLHESGTVPTPSSLVRDLDPAVERVVLRCLERDPARRPASALAVAAALPGGNPLAEALAAGETPSPDMLAAAGEVEAYAVAPGIAAVAWTIAGLLTYAALAPRATVARLVPLDKPPEVLSDRAEQILSRFGYTEARGDTAAGFQTHGDYLTWISATDRRPERWGRLASGRPPGLLYWYRTSPRDLVPRQLALTVTPNDPPPNDTNMHMVVLDTLGRLMQLNSVPPQFDRGDGAHDVPRPAPRGAEGLALGGVEGPWPLLFEEAGLTMTSFSAVTPQWTPRDFADTRAAWEGPLPGQPDIRIRVEAASYRGQPVSFAIIGPWSRPTRMQPPPRTTADRVTNTLLTVFYIALLLGALLLARQNLRAGRADRRGAIRIAAFLFSTEIAAWAIGYHHTADVRIETMSLSAIAADAVYVGLTIWIVYVALEPYCRRFWPDLLLGSSRLLSGHVLDPRVGRDILIGVSAGVLWLWIEVARPLVPPAFGYPQGMPQLGVQVLELSTSSIIALVWTTSVLRQLMTAFAIVLMFVVLRLITRRTSFAVAIGMFILIVISGSGDVFWWSPASQAPSFWLELVFQVAAVGLFTLVIIRGGLLAAAVALFIVRTGNATPFTLHTAHWSASGSNWTIALFVAIAMFGFYASRAGRPLFGNVEF